MILLSISTALVALTPCASPPHQRLNALLASEQLDANRDPLIVQVGTVLVYPSAVPILGADRQVRLNAPHQIVIFVLFLQIIKVVQSPGNFRNGSIPISFGRRTALGEYRNRKTSAIW